MITTPETFLCYLREIVTYQHRGRKVVRIWIIRCHHANILQPSLKEHRRDLGLDSLLFYSSKLNPIERVWKLTRCPCTHNRYFLVLDELAQMLLEQFDSRSERNKTLWRSIQLLKMIGCYAENKTVDPLSGGS